MATLRDIIIEFIDRDDAAKAWGGEPDDFRDTELDCVPVSERFRDLLIEHGREARVVHLEMDCFTDSLVGNHAVVEIEGLYIDWTARQWFDVNQFRLTYDEIPCPLVFVAGGPYPLPDLHIISEEA